jgi:hypothetical protein
MSPQHHSTDSTIASPDEMGLVALGIAISLSKGSQLSSPKNGQQ